MINPSLESLHVEMIQHAGLLIAMHLEEDVGGRFCRHQSMRMLYG